MRKDVFSQRDFTGSPPRSALGVHRARGASPVSGGARTCAPDAPVPEKKLQNLGELCLWLYGSRLKGLPSLIRSQNPDLKTLDLVLLDPKGVEALRNGLPLSVAHEISLGDERLFRASLQNAKQELQKARGTLSTGYSSDDSDSLVTAKEITHLSSDLLDEMMLKISKRLKTKRKKAN